MAKRNLITPDGVRKRATGWYRQVLVAGFRKEEFFPKAVRFGKITKNQIYYNHDKKVMETERLRKGSRPETGCGYTLVLGKKYTHKFGSVTVPLRIYIESLDEYLRYIGRKNEYVQFLADANFIKRRYPQLSDWIERFPRKVIKYSGEWDDLMKVCDYFVVHPEPNVYIEDLPIRVPEKFVKRHRPIIGRLLDELIPEYVHDEETEFAKRYNLKVRDNNEWYQQYDRELYERIMNSFKEKKLQENNLLEKGLKPTEE